MENHKLKNDRFFGKSFLFRAFLFPEIKCAGFGLPVWSVEIIRFALLVKMRRYAGQKYADTALAWPKARQRYLDEVAHTALKICETPNPLVPHPNN
eukprot:5102145-Amphidinium_carterae.1